MKAPIVRRLLLAGVSTLALAATGVLASPTGRANATSYPLLRPTVAEYAQVSTGETPPSQAQCAAAGRRCFAPQAVRAAYNLGPLYAGGFDGSGQTIAIVDAYGSDTMAHDLHVFDQAFGLQPMCGEEGVTCAPGLPTFSELHVQGSPDTKAPPEKAKSPGQEDKSAWALEVALDVETAHAIAPKANILLVSTPTAETLGVQGFPQMMNAEQYVVDHHLATVISQSFASAEGAFGSAQSIENLRHAYKSAAAGGVTVLGSSGDDGSMGSKKTPVGGKGGTTLPDPAVEWPASDPLVTGVGGTYLCTDPNATSGRTADSASQPAKCQANPGAAEVGWTFSGGGFSQVFDRPAYQSQLPAGSTPIGTKRGVPDIALQASSGTGALVYVSLPRDGQGGLDCGGTPCSAGWYDIGGTSLACPEWAGLVAIADQINGGGLGPINPALYRLAADPASYAADFYDITLGNNTADPSVPGYPATTGWDPVTGLGTPNAAKLLPDLVAAAHAG
ncbi:S53 family peptidase [Kitasatospora paracochleata]|uniref:Subtilase family serine protease n=1 Tax=Kitasatospora paracochleata TaxID=58354 RepID=A0ABT1IXT6_9ACTN|nr:S53 family peptidase [Kitasatospora paracochleata]MCP2309966.1 subtilase family serine protease [Kitasatospora paracochleata]